MPLKTALRCLNGRRPCNGKRFSAQRNKNKVVNRQVNLNQALQGIFTNTLQAKNCPFFASCQIKDFSILATPKLMM